MNILVKMLHLNVFTPFSQTERTRVFFFFLLFFFLSCFVLFCLRLLIRYPDQNGIYSYIKELTPISIIIFMELSAFLSWNLQLFYYRIGSLL